jgi:hypothetical protein
MEFRPGIFQWIPEAEWHQYVCAELLPIMTWLKQHEIEITAIGHWNIKAPDLVIFLSGPIPHRQLLADFPRHHAALVLRPDFIGCNDHRITVVYEKEPILEPGMSAHPKTLLILSVLGIAIVISGLLSLWAWREYAGFIERQPIAPIPVPAPP